MAMLFRFSFQKNLARTKSCAIWLILFRLFCACRMPRMRTNYINLHSRWNLNAIVLASAIYLLKTQWYIQPVDIMRTRKRLHKWKAAFSTSTISEKKGLTNVLSWTVFWKQLTLMAIRSRLASHIHTVKEAETCFSGSSTNNSKSVFPTYTRSSSSNTETSDNEPHPHLDSIPNIKITDGEGNCKTAAILSQLRLISWGHENVYTMVMQQGCFSQIQSGSTMQNEDQPIYISTH